MIDMLLKDRRLPEIWSEGSWEERREVIKDILQREEYGYLPVMETQVQGRILKEDSNFCAGHAPLKEVELTLTWPEDSYTFTIHTIIPRGGVKGTFLHLNWPRLAPVNNLPAEEICDRGFALAEVWFSYITSDADDFTDGLAGKLYRGRERQDSDPGKIAIWAWAAMRVMDYLETLPEIDSHKVAVVGHSRLGKTALVAAMMDERFALGISNDSGCSGAALSRGKEGESIEYITKTFPYWFCKNYAKYAGHEADADFDQHFLVAGIAPRPVYIASASQDQWADPVSEYLSGAAASRVYEKLGKPGLVHPDRLPQIGDTLQDGCIGYHLREGEHYISRYDWNRYMDYMERHICR